jgi:hypothetical protein
MNRDTHSFRIRFNKIINAKMSSEKTCSSRLFYAQQREGTCSIGRHGAEILDAANEKFAGKNETKSSKSLWLRPHWSVSTVALHVGRFFFDPLR